MSSRAMKGATSDGSEDDTEQLLLPPPFLGSTSPWGIRKAEGARGQHCPLQGRAGDWQGRLGRVAILKFGFCFSTFFNMQYHLIGPTMSQPNF